MEGRAQGRIHPLREYDGGRERGAVPCRMPGHIQTTARHQKGMAVVMVRRQHGRLQEHQPPFQGECCAGTDCGTLQKTEGRGCGPSSVLLLGQD